MAIISRRGASHQSPRRAEGCRYEPRCVCHSRRPFLLFAASLDAHASLNRLNSAKPTPVSAPHPVQNTTLRARFFLRFLMFSPVCARVSATRQNQNMMPFGSFWPAAISEPGWTRRKKPHLGFCLIQRGRVRAGLFELGPTGSQATTKSRLAGL